MSNEAILTAIFTKLGGISGLPQILYPNRKYPNNAMPTMPSEYIRVNVMPIPTATFSFDGGELKSGLIQCSIITPLDVGEIKGAIIGDKIITSMKNGTEISGELKVSKPPYSSSAIIEESSHMIPVTIQYKVISK